MGYRSQVLWVTGHFCKAMKVKGKNAVFLPLFFSYPSYPLKLLKDLLWITFREWQKRVVYAVELTASISSN